MDARTRGSDAGISAVAIALIAASAALVIVAGYIVFASLGGSDPDPTSTVAASPSASATTSAEPSPSASTSPTSVLAASWVDVPAGDRPALVADPHPGEPAARQWETWVWDYVDDGWDVEIWGQPDPAAANSDDPDAHPYLYQALYLVAPDGDRFRLYALGTDNQSVIEAKALDERIVWIDRYFYEASQTVQFDLRTGTVSESWADAGFANASPTANAGGWFVYYVATLDDGRMLWEGSGFGAPLNGVFFRSPGGAITPSAVNPHLDADTEFGPVCLGADTNSNIAIYEGYAYAAGQPVANWPARLVVQNLATDTWTVLTRNGPYGTPCHDDFSATSEYYIGLANRTDQTGLYRYYYDGRPDQPA